VTHSDWTTTFFNGLAVEFWVTIAPPPKEAEIEFLRSIFGDGGELLDVACGAGRYTIPLSHAGYSMTGVDLSDEFLSVARQREPRIAWHRGDIRELPWRERFNGALCFGNSFGYFPPEETRDFLRGVARALKPGSTFVLEAPATAELLLPSLQRERRIVAGDITFSSVNRYDAEQRRLDIEYTFEKGGVRETKAAVSWIFTVAEVAEMLADAGLAVETIHASAIFVARK
jgi:SAM-dependent methyltransferase